MNGCAEGFADYGVVIDPDRNWLASVMERAQRTINISLGGRERVSLAGSGGTEATGKGGERWSQISRYRKSSRDPVTMNRFDNWTINSPSPSPTFPPTLGFYHTPTGRKNV